MKLHFLRYFVVLAEELHFRRAAEKLNITQPPLSNAIRALEEELDATLLIRDSRHVELTQAGVAFLEEAHHILNRVARASKMTKLVANGMRGHLEIGMTGSLIYREVPAIVGQLRREMPDVEVLLKEMSSADQLSELMRGQLHAGFVNGATTPPQLSSLSLGVDEFVVCLPTEHPKSKDRMVDLKQLAEERFVMFSREVSPANHDNVIAIFTRAGIHPQTAHAARQWLTIVAMVANGFGVSLVPRTMAKSRVHGVKFVEIAGHQVEAPALLAWNPSCYSPALGSFIACAKSVLSKSSC